MPSSATECVKWADGIVSNHSAKNKYEYCIVMKLLIYTAICRGSQCGGDEGLGCCGYAEHHNHLKGNSY